MYVVLVKIENICISDVKINVSSYFCYVKDLEFIVVVVLVFLNYLYCFFKSLIVIWLMFLKNKEFCSNYCRKRDYIFRILEIF